VLGKRKVVEEEDEGKNPRMMKTTQKNIETAAASRHVFIAVDFIFLLLFLFFSLLALVSSPIPD